VAVEMAAVRPAMAWVARRAEGELASVQMIFLFLNNNKRQLSFKKWTVYYQISIEALSLTNYTILS